MKGRTLSGEVEVDGAFFGGYVKPKNKKLDRVDRRLKESCSGKRRVVVIMRERDGKSLPYVCTGTKAGKKFEGILGAFAI